MRDHALEHLFDAEDRDAHAARAGGRGRSNVRPAECSALLAALDDCLVHEAATVADAASTAANADIILLDLGMPDAHGLAGLLAIVGIAPLARVIVVTGNETPGLEALVSSAGGHGLVLKSAPMTVLVQAIHAVMAGDNWFPAARPAEPAGNDSPAGVADRIGALTLAERRVLGAMCDGSLNKQIAFRFGLSEITVKQHVKAVLRKLNVVNRTQAALLMQFHDQFDRLAV